MRKNRNFSRREILIVAVMLLLTAPATATQSELFLRFAPKIDSPKSRKRNSKNCILSFSNTAFAAKPI